MLANAAFSAISHLIEGGRKRIGFIGARMDPRVQRRLEETVLPGLGTYQQEASLALIRYWAHVAGVPDSTVAAMSRATGLPEFNRDITNDQP